MVFRAEQDIHYWRWGLAVNLLLLIALFTLIAFRDYRSEWRQLQFEFFQNRNQKEVKAEVGIREITNCDEQSEHCTTCHLNVWYENIELKQDSKVFGPHPDIILTHAYEQFGCTTCHGGNGWALDSTRAHQRIGTSEKDPRMTKPFVYTSCPQCHTLGAFNQTESIERGFYWYYSLGCAMCHNMQSDGRGGWDYGPSLRDMGEKSIRFIRQSILEPEVDFMDSTMPSFKATFAQQETALFELEQYVMALSLPPASPNCQDLPRSFGLLNVRCAQCHQFLKESKQDFFQHRCTFIFSQSDQLTCRRCHFGNSIPDKAANEGWCPYIKQHRSGCVGCHWRRFDTR